MLNLLYNKQTVNLNWKSDPPEGRPHISLLPLSLLQIKLPG